MRNKKLSNKLTILKHLVTIGNISPLEALMVHRIVRLAPRIQELRELGFDIRTTTKTDAAGTVYTRYVFSPTVNNRYLAHDLLP